MFVKSRSDWYSLDLSGAELYQYCCQWMEKASPCLCSHSGPVSEMWTNCVFTCYVN